VYTYSVNYCCQCTVCVVYTYSAVDVRCVSCIRTVLSMYGVCRVYVRCCQCTVCVVYTYGAVDAESDEEQEEDDGPEHGALQRRDGFRVHKEHQPRTCSDTTALLKTIQIIGLMLLMDSSPIANHDHL